MFHNHSYNNSDECASTNMLNRDDNVKPQTESLHFHSSERTHVKLKSDKDKSFSQRKKSKEKNKHGEHNLNTASEPPDKYMIKQNCVKTATDEKIQGSHKKHRKRSHPDKTQITDPSNDHLEKIRNSSKNRISSPNMNKSASALATTPSEFSFDPSSGKKGFMENSVKTPKVKTTAELIAELQHKTGRSDYGKKILQKLKSNEIECEADIQKSVVPTSMKPRKRQHKNGGSLMSVPSQNLSKTKNELVEKFLQTSVSSPREFCPVNGDFAGKLEPESSSNSPLPARPSDNEEIREQSTKPSDNMVVEHTVDVVESVVEKVEEKDSNRLSIEEIYQKLPPIDFSVLNEDESEEAMETCSVSEVTDSDVDRTLNTSWPGVNGCVNSCGDWHDWCETFAQSHDTESQLHILPYVIIDD